MKKIFSSLVMFSVVLSVVGMFPSVSSATQQCDSASQTIVSDASTLKNGNPAVLITTPYNERWTVSIPGATWIWGEDPITNPVDQTSETFTRAFTITGTPVGATLDIAADNSYEVSVNGHAVGSDATEFNYQTIHTHSIPASDLLSGANTITFTVTNWAMVEGTPEINPAGLLYKLVVNENDCHTPPPTDVCPNIDGMQATIPNGDQLLNGNCIPTIVPPSNSCPLPDGNGWFGQYYNESSTDIGMELPGDQWGNNYGNPLSADNSFSANTDTWTANWYDSQFYRFSRVDSNLMFGPSWFPFDSASEQLQGGHEFDFATHWSAKVTAPSTGDYAYNLTPDDDVWVYVDGVLVVDKSGVHSASLSSGNINLTAGTHIVDVYFAERHVVQSEMSFEFTDTSLVIKPYNPDCTPPSTKATINATKIVCPTENLLPNWGAGGPDVTSATVSTFLTANPTCHIEPWTFEWAPSSTANPGDQIDVAGGVWTAFTGGTTTISTPVDPSYVWVREQMQNGYIPFSGATTNLDETASKNSAEMYCNTDVLNYDNYDRVDDMVAGQTYNCVAFNVPTTPAPVCEANVNLLANGGFESPVVTNPALWDIFNFSATPSLAWLASWINPTGAPQVANVEIQKNGLNGGWTASEGTQWAELDGDYYGPSNPSLGHPAVAISQDIVTIPSDNYTVSFDFSARPGTSAAENVVEVLANNVVIGTVGPTAGVGTTAWSSHSFNFTATGALTTIALRDAGTPNNSLGTLIDNVSAKCVPDGELTTRTITVLTYVHNSNHQTITSVLNGSTVHDSAEVSGTTNGTPSLGTAGTYGVLASTFTANGGSTAITGDAGYTSVTGNHTVSGVNNQPAPVQSGLDQATVLASLNGQACTFTFAPGAINLATDTTHGPVGFYTPGVYCTAASSAASIGTAGITLSGAGTFIFRIDGALTTVDGSTVSLTAGASASDLFWTPTAATTLGANTTFKGTIIDDAGITVGTTTAWIGRALAFGGTVITDTDTILVPSTSGPIPTGTVDFTFYPNSSCTAGTGSAAGTGIALVAGIAHPSSFEGPLSVGSYAFKAHYNGDSNYSPADGLCEPFTVSEEGPTTGTLIVKKVVVNDNGGTKTANNFSFQVNGGTAIPFEADGQNDLIKDAGSYTITEPAVVGYTTTYSDNCSNVVVPAGGTATCTITNNDIAPNPNSPSSDLRMGKTADKESASVGDTVTFTLTVTNDGPDSATGVTVSDVLPAGLTFVSANPSADYNSSTGVWTVGTLASTASATLTISATVNVGKSGENITNTASTSNTNDSNSNNNSGSTTVNIKTQCSDGKDNDGDGLIDQADPGCHSDGNASNTESYVPSDNNETNGEQHSSIVCPDGEHLVGDNCVVNYTGGGRIGGSVLGASTGQVLGESTSCGIYLDKYLQKGRKNNPEAVKKVQQFLNDYLQAGLKVDGKFGPKTDQFVRQFQAGHQVRVLDPWGLTGPTGIVYLTTQTEINNIMCPTLNLPIPTNLIPTNLNPEFPVKG